MPDVWASLDVFPGGQKQYPSRDCEEEKKQFHTLKVLFGIYTPDKWVEKEECVTTETGALQITHMKQLWVPMSSPCSFSNSSLQNLLPYKDKQIHLSKTSKRSNKENHWWTMPKWETYLPKVPRVGGFDIETLHVFMSFASLRFGLFGNKFQKNSSNGVESVAERDNKSPWAVFLELLVQLSKKQPPLF